MFQSEDFACEPGDVELIDGVLYIRPGCMIDILLNAMEQVTGRTRLELIEEGIRLEAEQVRSEDADFGDLLDFRVGFDPAA